jgi:exosortase
VATSADSFTRAVPAGGVRSALPAVLALALFAILFAQPLRLLALDWWNDPEAGHGLLLAPLAIWLAWRAGVRPEATPQPALGTVVLVAAVVLRYLSGLAAELYTMRMSAMLALAGLVIFVWGVGQLRRWWLPFALLCLSVPLPSIVTNALALPLQFRASRMGASLLEWRHVPVRLAGNVILLPGHKLFVTEACSGLRSLTALLSLGVLLGGMALRKPLSRVLLIALAIPVAILINGIRVFLTGFLVYFVSPELGDGFMHLTEGWLLFLVAFGVLGLLAWILGSGEAWLSRRRAAHA